MSRRWDRFKSSLLEIGVRLTPSQYAQFKNYYNLLLEANKRVNLISRRDEARVLSYHFIDSLICLPFIPEKALVCDLGSGGGLPGIPVKIMRDDISLWLVESIRKKWFFLKDAISKLNLKNTYAINKRAEQINDMEFDIVLARLVGELKEVVKTAVHLLKPSGGLLAYKSKGVEEELNKAEESFKRTKLKVREIRNVRLLETNILRRIIIIDRMGSFG